MLFRFSAYGFLKNLRFFEAFLFLALLERGLSFFQIGSLIAVREVTINILELPSGAIADGFGRRRCMVISMLAYLASFIILGLVSAWSLLAVAMFLYGAGDAFRSGTHKALIYAWLRQQNRTAERTRVYGFTRSWSKRGSALAALIGGLLLLVRVDYDWVILASAIPVVLNLVNLATYPASLDDAPTQGLLRAGDWWRHLATGLRLGATRASLRRLIIASMAVEGGYAVTKDYVQPLLKALAIGLPIGAIFGWQLDGRQRTGIIVGAVSTGLFLIASAAARRSHRVEERCGDAERGAHFVALSMLIGYIALGIALVFDWSWFAAAIFVGLAVGQNLWRPMHVGRFDRDEERDHAATILSIESQAKSVAAAILAPLVGAMIDATTEPGAIAAHDLWPIVLVGLPLVFVVLDRPSAPSVPSVSPADPSVDGACNSIRSDA